MGVAAGAQQGSGQAYATCRVVQGRGWVAGPGSGSQRSAGAATGGCEPCPVCGLLHSWGRMRACREGLRAEEMKAFQGVRRMGPRPLPQH